MRKILFFTLLATSFSNAQTIEEGINKIGENIDINVYLRSSYEISDNEDKTNGFKVNEARMEIMGNITENLKFRTRWRMNRQVAPSSVSNAPSSLDYAYVGYQFGEEKKYSITVGKQMNNFGSWEFYDNPTFEYQYSDYINRQQNLFPVGVEFAYKINPNNSIHIQGFNPYTSSFDELHTNAQYKKNNLEKSKFPLGINLTWKGNLWDNKFKTIYTLTTSHIAKGKHNYQVSLGNKLVLDKFSGYLDLHHTDMKVDYNNIISSHINAHYSSLAMFYEPVFAQNIQFQSVALRLNYAITSKWSINAKSVFERVNRSKNSSLGNNLKNQYINQLAFEYQPFEKQDFKLFGYYAHFNNSFAKSLQTFQPNDSYGIFAIGALWFLNAL